MSAVKSRSSRRSLVLTPERIPDFLIPSHGPLLRLSPRSLRGSPSFTRLLSDHDDDSPAETPPSSAAPSGLWLGRLPQPIKVPGRAADAEATEFGDTDLTTRAATSLRHVDKVTTPYGFRAVLAASPCTRRRESIFHRKKQSPVPKIPDIQNQDPDQQECLDSNPAPDPASSRGTSLISLRPIKALGLQVMKELKRPAASRNAQDPGSRGTETR